MIKPKQHEKKKLLIRYLSVLALILILILVLKDRFSAKDFTQVIKELSLLHILILSSISLLLLLVRSFNWMMLLNSTDHHKKLPFKTYLFPTMASHTLNLIIPGKGGELIRFIYLRKEFPMGLCFGSVVFERLIDFLLLITMSLSGGILISNRSYTLPSAITLSILVIIFIASFNTNFLSAIGRLSQTVLKSDRIAAFILDYDSFNNFLKQSPHIAVIFIFLSVLQWLAALLQFYLMFQFIGTDIALSQVAIRVPIGILISLLPISIGGIGTREVVFFLLFESIASVEQILAFSLLFYLFRYLFLGIIGIMPFLFIKKEEPVGEPI